MVLAKRRIHIEFLDKNLVRVTTAYRGGTFEINSSCILDLVNFKIINTQFNGDLSNVVSTHFITFDKLELSKEEVITSSLYVQCAEDRVSRVNPVCYYKFKQHTWNAVIWI
jgi:hypothetical protein